MTNDHISEFAKFNKPTDRVVCPKSPNPISLNPNLSKNLYHFTYFQKMKCPWRQADRNPNLTLILTLDSAKWDSAIWNSTKWEDTNWLCFATNFCYFVDNLYYIHYALFTLYRIEFHVYKFTESAVTKSYRKVHLAENNLQTSTNVVRCWWLTESECCCVVWEKLNHRNLRTASALNELWIHVLRNTGWPIKRPEILVWTTKHLNWSKSN